MSDPVKIVAILVPHAGKAGALRALLERLAAASRAEPGNLRWDIWQEQGATGRILLDELYVDKEAAAAHRETPHFREYLSHVGDLADRTALTLDPLDMVRASPPPRVGGGQA